MGTAAIRSDQMNGRKLYVYENVAYLHCSQIMRPFPRALVNDEKIEFNYERCSLRVLKEHNYKELMRMWSAQDFACQTYFFLKPMGLLSKLWAMLLTHPRGFTARDRRLKDFSLHSRLLTILSCPMNSYLRCVHSAVRIYCCLRAFSRLCMQSFPPLIPICIFKNPLFSTTSLDSSLSFVSLFTFENSVPPIILFNWLLFTGMFLALSISSVLNSCTRDKAVRCSW